jgi:hypothetical protein
MRNPNFFKENPEKNEVRFRLPSLQQAKTEKRRLFSVVS